MLLLMRIHTGTKFLPTMTAAPVAAQTVMFKCRRFASRMFAFIDISPAGSRRFNETEYCNVGNETKKLVAKKAGRTRILPRRNVQRLG